MPIHGLDEKLYREPDNYEHEMEVSCPQCLQPALVYLVLASAQGTLTLRARCLRCKEPVEARLTIGEVMIRCEMLDRQEAGL